MRRRIKLLLPVLAVLSALVVNIPGVLAAGDSYFQVNGAIFQAEVAPGETYTHTMSVTTASDAPPLDVLVEAKGYGQALDGTILELESAEDTSRYSARSYITGIDKPSFRLEPGETQQVTATISVPVDLGDGTKYAILHVHTEPHGEGNVGVIVAADVPVVLTPRGTQQSLTGAITGLTVQNVEPGKPLTISTIFKNTGNHHYKAQNYVEITDSGGSVITSAAVT
jgi:hypothetical protein